ncbi:MAG: EF-hand domain-containing protein [Devosiaceae bacterium]|nr:EF-hand domain-containing protein [Devosiaceae bacterium]
MTKKIVTIATLASLLLAGSAMAQGNAPGSGFIENWDLDGNGAVTLEEIIEKRGEVFYMFDQEDDGLLSAENYKLFDEARAADQAQAAGNANGARAQRGAKGMTLEFNDTNKDGQVSLEEFIENSDEWFAIMDQNGDGEVTSADFGPKT